MCRTYTTLTHRPETISPATLIHLTINPKDGALDADGMDRRNFRRREWNDE